MSVEVKGLNKLKKSLSNLHDHCDDEEIKNEIANFLLLTIKSRTAKGYDSEGEAFEEYSKAYSLFRQAKGLSVYLVDLFFSGSMMSAMTYEIAEDSIRLFFQNTKDKKEVSNSEKAFWLSKKRDFFSLNFDEILEARNIYEDYLTEEL